MELKWTITLGEAIQIVAIVVGLAAGYNKLVVKIVRMETKVNMLYNWWNRQVRAYMEDLEEDRG